MIRSRESLIGAWAFLVGLIIAVLTGVLSSLPSVSSTTSWTAGPILYAVLAFLGLVLGYFVAETEVRTFLIATVSVVVVCFAGIQGQVLNAALLGVGFNKMVGAVLGALVMLFIPATIVVALKTVFAISKS